jgi:proteasome lid subunit RPN8/RPN11
MAKYRVRRTMIDWKETEPDVRPDSLTVAFQKLDCLSAIHGMVNLTNGVRVYALASCVRGVREHVVAHRKEIGGLLLGRVYQADGPRMQSAGPLTFLTDWVPSNAYRNSSVSLVMGTDVWSRASEHFLGGDIVVGWYHSHPGLGAFFSATDRRTQSSFFRHAYSLGWVIDSLRGEQRVFYGADAQEYPHNIVVLDRMTDSGPFGG